MNTFTNLNVMSVYEFWNLRKDCVTVSRISRKQKEKVKTSFKRPTFPDREMTSIEVIKALNWYNSEYKRKNCKKFLKEYLVYSERKEESKELTHLPDNLFSTTAAWLANMLVNEALLPMSNIEFVENHIFSLLEYSRENRIIDLNLL